MAHVLSALVIGALATVATALSGPPTLTFSKDGRGLQLGGVGLAPDIWVSQQDWPGVIRAAKDLAADFGLVLGTNGTVTVIESAPKPQNSSRPVIIVGSLDRLSMVSQLVTSKKLDATNVTGKWETFSSQLVPSPIEGVDSTALVIAGSDLRGTVFGIYDISQQIGVSPWYWWADVPPRKREYIFAEEKQKTQGPPSVKFRGIFFNDESPGLTGWAGAVYKMSQYGSPFGTPFYSRVFELVLRLGGNYVWPAMWSSMFYLDDTGNGPLATEYGIFMGTSHHEPMARADKEQGRFCRGSWDWKSNKANIQTFMTEGVQRSKNWSTIYTLGMRGSGDAASATLDSKTLEDVIRWQQSAITSALGAEALQKIPQAWVMYKEVPGYWKKGMNVEEHVTLLWTDDNRGNIRRIPIGNETARPGGAGMYYHFDYVGSPRNYKWINTIQLEKTWEQMSLAYYQGIQNIWIVNVGDLKALELPTHHFMDLAYDMTALTSPDSTGKWLYGWAQQTFGETFAQNITDIMTVYGKLVARRKYEDLSIMPFAFSAVAYDEAEKNYQEWEGILAHAQAVYDKLPAESQDSFFELVLHPCLAGKTVFEIYSKAALGKQYATEHRTSTNTLASDANAAFSADTAITKRYHSLKNNKWNHILDQTHIGYNNWQEPARNSMPALSSVSSTSQTKANLLGVSGQSVARAFPDQATITLMPISPYMPPSESRWVDIFTRDDGTFSYTISSNASYVTLSNAEGTLTSPGNRTTARSVISVDWSSVPSGSSTVTLQVVASGKTAVVTLPLTNTDIPADFKGHVEFNRVVSIEANHFKQINQSADQNVTYVSIPNYGRTLAGVKLWPLTAKSQTPTNAPILTYPFYIFSSAASPSITVYLSSSENANPDSPNRYAFSIDNGAQTVVQPTPIGDPAGEPSGWDNAVTNNAWVKTSKIENLAAGSHQLNVRLLEPTMVITKIVLDLGGVKSSTLGPPESFIQT
ncbi:hypothetical protein O1611_g1079 [Lasiodiplodia mahajangana]|uniref:Uncharacterized protein n=1 Tax=Lasiodiplodia mahajangana TaxID=1108764 RepID=A0ACC2JYG1_9PEZI|nr:hypothetical protein O1611_g1079 [Lasiodiplodia mahajangana]